MDILKLDVTYRSVLSLPPVYDARLPPPTATSTAWYRLCFEQRMQKERALQARAYDVDFYVLETGLLLDSYAEELRRPMKWVFGQRNTMVNRVKRNIISAFRDALSRLYISDVYPRRFDGLLLEEKPQGLVCYCGGTEFTPLPDYESMIVCQLCGAQIEQQQSFDYNDSQRVHISQRASNEKRSHFLNCFNQYAGVQKITLAPELIQQIEDALVKYNLSKNRVTKEHIRLILQDLKLNRVYGEYLTLIYCKIVGTNMDHVVALRSAVMNDFDQFNELYQRRFQDKKPYNYQQLLFQFLRRHGHSCDYSEFNFLKTTERKIYHEEKQQQLFAELGWNYTPLL